MGTHHHNNHLHHPTQLHFHPQQPTTRWPAPSRPHESRPVERHPASSSPLRQLARVHHRLVVSRSLTATSPEPSLSVRSVATRSRPSSSSASCPSSVLFVRLPRTSSPISASSPPPSVLFRSPSRLTLSRSSRTPTSAPSTPSVSPSRARTSSSPAASVVSVVKLLNNTSTRHDNFFGSVIGLGL